MVKNTAHAGVLKALLISNLVSVVLFALRVLVTQDTRYLFLFWNLLLAWIPLFWAWLLQKHLKTHAWREPLCVVLTLLWLAFLPNSFYLMSDLVHLQNTGEIGLLFDSVLFLSCIWNGAIAGFLSMYWLHKAVLRRRSPRRAAVAVGVVLLLTSFAIYLGRNLRWNSWDILANPAALLFDVSDRLVSPLAHPQVFLTTSTYFILLSSMYLVIWNLAGALQREQPRL